MAEVLESFEFLPFPRRTAMVEWKPFLDGQIHKLTRGVDWPMQYTAQAAATSAHSYARRHLRGVKVRTRVPDGKTIVIQAYTP